MLLLVLSCCLAACRKNPYRDGADLYKHACASCHLENGRGLGALIPPLSGSDFLVKNRDQLPCILRHGLADTIQVNGVQYAEKMEGVKGLSDIQITNVLNYVQTNWGNRNPVYSLEEVRQLLDRCPK